MKCTKNKTFFTYKNKLLTTPLNAESTTQLIDN